MQLVTYWKRAVLNKFADFTGRDSRPELWWFILASVLVSAALNIVQATVVGALWSLAMLVPTLAANTRRLHDTGRSGWWQLLVLIPLVGGIIVIVWLASSGTPTANKYGAPRSGSGSSPLPPPPPPTVT